MPVVSSTSEGREATLADTDGWSDLPSDAEDTFFFSREEAEDFHRDKRRRIIEQGRQERLRALRDENDDEEDMPHDDDPWGGSDEEVGDELFILDPETYISRLDSQMKLRSS